VIVLLNIEDIVYPQQLLLICWSLDLLYGPENGSNIFERKMVNYKIIRHHIQENTPPDSHRQQNIKSNKAIS
jgi:hypothetical protein